MAVHPQFAQNQFVYLSYTKGTAERSTMALARAKFDGAKLSDVKEIFVADAWGTGAAAGRAKFGPDGMLYLTVGDRDNQVFTENNASRVHAQDLASHVGKVLRLRDDGTAAPDNPFVKKAGAKPEIYTYGHRNVHGLAWHPDTRELWAVEIGPMGGDELNVLKPGANYGWPHVSLGGSTPAAPCPTSRGSGPAWRCRRCSGCRPSARPAWRSTPATASRCGRATSSSAA